MDRFSDEIGIDEDAGASAMPGLAALQANLAVSMVEAEDGKTMSYDEVMADAKRRLADILAAPDRRHG